MTNNIDRLISEALQTGTLSNLPNKMFINGCARLMEYYAGGIEVPFGGNKLSGIGREKDLASLTAYSKIKAVTTRL